MRVGLIGAGRWGRNAARAIAANATLAWVADSDTAAAIALADQYGVPVHRPLDFDACDAVWVCTPIETHELVVHAALSHHKNVLCEKPLSRSRAQAVDLAAEAERRGLVLAADHTWLGHAGLLDLVHTPGVYRYEATRMAQDGRGFDALEDLLPHDVALAAHAMGPVRRVRVVGLGANLDHGNDCISQLQYSYTSPEKVRKVTIRATGGVVKTNGGELPAGSPEPLGVVLREFIAAIEGHRQPAIGGPAEFIHVAAVIEAAKRSRAKGGWVDVV